MNSAGSTADDAVEPGQRAAALHFLAEGDEHEHEDERDIEQKRYNTEAHHGGQVVVDENAPEYQRIRQVGHEADHAEHDGDKADERRGLENRRVLRNLVAVAVKHERHSHGAARDACEEQVHGDRPRPGDPLAQTKCKVHGDVHLYTPCLTMGM